MDEEGTKRTFSVDGEMTYETKVTIALPAQFQVSSSVCPKSWPDPNVATNQSSRSVPSSSQIHSSCPSPWPEPHHVSSPGLRPDQKLNLTSEAYLQQYSYPSYQVSSSGLSMRPVVQNSSPSFRPSHSGIKSNQSGARQLTFEPVVLGSGRTAPSQVEMPSNPSPYPSPSEASHANRRRSIVWTEFERKTIDGRDYAICNTCTSKLTAGKGYGTRHLHSHMQRCKRVKTFDTRQQAQRTNKGTEKVTVEPQKRTFNQEVSRRDIVNAIIIHGYPLNILNHYGLQKFIRGLQPMFKMVTTHTIKKDIIKIYDFERDKIICLLENLDCRVAITTKMWIAKQTEKSYMAVTAHFIDEAWVIQSQLLRFIYIPHPHDAEVLTEYLMDALLEWGLGRKLSTIMVDDAKNDPESHNFLDKLDASSLLLDGQVLHICCFEKILDIIVRDVLEVVSESIDKVRNGVMHCSVSVQRIDEFKKACDHLCIPYTKKLCLDVTACWNSTLLMLQTALLYKDVFYIIEQEETCHTSMPSDRDWVLVKEICGNLQPFYNMTESFRGATSFTLNCYFAKICEIKVAISKWIDSPLEIVQMMASQAIDKYDKYWGLCHRIIGIACVFDPRYKLKLVEYFYRIIYSDEAMLYVNRIRDDCYALQRDYQSKNRTNHDLGASSSTSSSVSECKEEDPLTKFDLFVASQVPVMSEMDLYLDECVLPRTVNFDVLNWWKANGLKFPTLQKIALDILAIPASSSTSKSTSGKNQMLSSHRSRLNHTMTEALMCTQYWLQDEVNATCSSQTQLVTSTLDDEDEDKDEDKDEDDDGDADDDNVN